MDKVHCNCVPLGEVQCERQRGGIVGCRVETDDHGVPCGPFDGFLTSDDDERSSGRFRESGGGGPENRPAKRARARRPHHHHHRFGPGSDASQRRTGHVVEQDRPHLEVGGEWPISRTASRICASASLRSRSAPPLSGASATSG